MLNPHRFAAAAATAEGLYHIVSTIIWIIVPEFGLQGYAAVIHLASWEKYATDYVVTPIGFLVGTVQVIIGAYILGWLLATAYNYLGKK